MGNVQEICVPDIGGASDVEVIELLIAVGDKVAVEQGLITLETDKATMDVPSPNAGVVTRLLVKEGERVSEGSVIAELEVGEQDRAEQTAASAAAAEVSAEDVEAKNTSSPMEDASESAPPVLPHPKLPEMDLDQISYSSPSIRKLARELDVDLTQVKGTGPRNRITRDDVHGFVQSVMRSGGADATPFKDLLPWPEVDFAKFGPVTRQPLSRIRKISGANLHRNWVTIPHVTNHEDADITALEAFRVALNRDSESTGVKVTLVALLIKAIVAALKKFPEFNASLDGDTVVLKGYYHIGFATDTPNGLVVPVIRDADKKGILELAGEVSALAAKAREGKLTALEMSGSCFSISSLGGIGGTYFTPIINAPEIAILGVARARTQVVWNGSASEPRLILPMSLSWDHRVVDGAQAGRFNAYLANVLADFRRALL